MADMELEEFNTRDSGHRHGEPTPGITFESLFANYVDGPQKIRDDEGNPLDPWLGDGFYGAEWDVWL